MKTLTKIIAPALIASLALGAAVPASAASYHKENRFEIGQQIRELDRKIDQAERRHLISDREADRLERKVDQVRKLHANYARNGFTKGELRTLDQRLDQVERQIALEIRDRDGRRG